MLWTLFAVSATCQQTNISSEWLQLIFSPFPLLLCEVVLTCDHCSLSVCAENIYTTAALWFWIRAYERLSVMFVCYLSEGQGNIDISGNVRSVMAHKSAFKRLSTTSQWSVSSGIFFSCLYFQKKKRFFCVCLFFRPSKLHGRYSSTNSRNLNRISCSLNKTLAANPPHPLRSSKVYRYCKYVHHSQEIPYLIWQKNNVNGLFL